MYNNRASRQLEKRDLFNEQNGWKDWEIVKKTTEKPQRLHFLQFPNEKTRERQWKNVCLRKILEKKVQKCAINIPDILRINLV